MDDSGAGIGEKGALAVANVVEPQASLVVLPAVVDLENATLLQLDLTAALEADAPLNIDASAVLELSTAGAQLLIAAAIVFERKGRAVALLAPSDEVISAFQDLGLFNALFDRVSIA